MTPCGKTWPYSEVPAQGVDALRALMHQQIAGPEYNPVRLLLLALNRNKPHRRPLRRLANRLGIRGVVLLPFNEWFDIGRRDQTHGVAKRLKLTSPVMRPGTGLHRHGAAGLHGEEFNQLRPGKTLAEDHVTGFIRTMRLENVFGDIKSDCSSLSHGRLPQVDDQRLHLGT
jgi:hypothetical protein